MTLCVVDVPHFYAALIVGDGNIVLEAAPILRWAIGKHLEDVHAWAVAKGGDVFNGPLVSTET